ncbi:hypothetical protein Pelo_8029 [Pelomyxa schiedti]|nr:hypothetical protein Pelo_8029 [Pelomyxa schiedti]
MWISGLSIISPIEPMLRLSMNSWINILHCLYSVIGGRPDVHLLQVGFDSGFNFVCKYETVLKDTLTHEVHLHCWGRYLRTHASWFKMMTSYCTISLRYKETAIQNLYEARAERQSALRRIQHEDEPVIFQESATQRQSYLMSQGNSGYLEEQGPHKLKPESKPT